MRDCCQRLRLRIWSLLVLALASFFQNSTVVSAQEIAAPLSGTVEAIIIPSVGGTFQTIGFENSYTNATPVCIYNLPSNANNPAVVRIQSVGSGSMQVRLQEPRDSAAVTAGPVYCLVAETGVNILPDGRRIEARQVVSTTTVGRSTPATFPNPNATTDAPYQNISGSFSGFTNAIALGQVMTFNDNRFTHFHSNDCDARANPPFLSGFADGICVAKSVAEDFGANNSRLNETLGVIVIESSTATGSYDGISYEVRRGAQTIDGVQNSGEVYGLTASFPFITGALSGAQGGDGGWAVILGANAVGGSSVRFGIDEDQLANAERGHITEVVDYFAVDATQFVATKTVDQTQISSPVTLNYQIGLRNNGFQDLSGVAVTDTLPDSSAGTVTGPTESGTTDGVMEPGETFTYTISYAATTADISAGLDLVNNVSANTTQTAALGIANQTASATTTINVVSSLTVTKTADKTVNVAAGEEVTYTYVVTNNGNQVISNVSLDDVHNGSGPAPSPANETLTVDNGTTGDSVNGPANDGTWNTLGPGDVVTFTATYTVTQSDVDTLQ